MIILGLDPGFDRVGWGMIDRQGNKITLVDCGCIETSKKAPFAERLRAIYEELCAVIESQRPERAVIETLFFATNAKTAMHVAQARGVIMLVCEQHHLEIVERTPLQIKQSAAGDGQADKKAVEKMVRLQIKNIPLKLLDDTL